ncbi:3-keto-5-aminohexanoate cleavage protein [Thaumasiovibrio sp. DFM-14]|uniref:3-keto-5-aminohexanoate cleavage protein n=1 Tax=Thaumasiovibrio sp. DFM-14 TaxID=3384792 RepID=UPI0039A1B7B9
MTAIIVAPNGARRDKTDCPNIPITLDEMLSTALACRDAGASILHVHVRDETGAHTLDHSLNQQWLAKLEAKLADSMVVQMTTESVGRYSYQDIATYIATVPAKAISVALNELFPPEVLETSQLEGVRKCLTEAQRRGALIQYILYHPDELETYQTLVAKQVLPSQHHLLVVLGKISPQQQARPQELNAFLKRGIAETGVRWAVCAFGLRELECLEYALGYGADLRVGFENNICLPNGILATSNAEQVEAVTRVVLRQGYRCLDADEIRAALKNQR